jgi:uncharacterized protein
VRILIDISHPAHVHVFRHPIRLLRARGNTVAIASRDKDCALALLNAMGLNHECLSIQNRGKVTGMIRELVGRNRALARLARSFRPDIMAGLGGICVAQVGRWLSIPSVVFYDTETAHLQNALTYPFATKVVVPDCYGGWTPRRRTLRYRGYHELAYLHPDYFSPSRDIALANGLASSGDTFLIRVVSWKANHDLGQRGWTNRLLETVVDRLTVRGKVIISAEGSLPPKLEGFRFAGQPGEMHHLIAFCRALIGESATMASESAVLGVPAVYAAPTSIGYVNELDRRYGLVKVTSTESDVKVISALEFILSISQRELNDRHQKLLEECVDVSRFVAETILDVGSRPR